MSAAASQGSARTPDTALMAVRSSAWLCVAGCELGKPRSEHLRNTRRRCATPRTDWERRVARQITRANTNKACRTLWPTKARPKSPALIRLPEAEMSGLLRITTKLRHAGPATQDLKRGANRRCLERLVRYPIFRNSHLALSQIKSAMIFGGELIRQLDASVCPVPIPLPAT